MAENTRKCRGPWRSPGPRRCLGEVAAALGALVLALQLAAPACGAIVTVFSDNFAADSVGSSPGTPVIGMPWVIGEPVSTGVDVRVDPTGTYGNVLEFGLDYDTAQAPVSSASQAVIGSNENALLSFTYHGLAGSGGYVSTFDAAMYGPNGSPVSMIRIMSQPISPTSSLHEIYYLSPTSGLVDSGLSVSSTNWQTLSLAVDLVHQTAQLKVGSTVDTLPLFTCPSTIGSAQFGSYAMGSGVLGSGMIDNVTISSSSATSANGKVPEPMSLVVLTGGIVMGALAWAFRALRRRR